MGAPEVSDLVYNYLYMPQMQGDTAEDSQFRLIPTPEDRRVFHLIVEKGSCRGEGRKSETVLPEGKADQPSEVSELFSRF